MNGYEHAALISIFTASLLGSPHCVGMCGGFVALYSHESKKQFSAHIQYNLGRLTTYLTLGFIAAVAGTKFDKALGISNFSALLIGLILVFSGLMQLIGQHVNILTYFSEKYANLLHRLLKPVFKVASNFKPYFIGLITTLLPCGWLYTFVALAFASASWKSGILIMFVFWLGTLPALGLTGVFSRFITARLGKFLPRISSLLVISAGIFSIYSHYSHSSHNHHVHHEHSHGEHEGH